MLPRIRQLSIDVMPKIFIKLSVVKNIINVHKTNLNIKQPSFFTFLCATLCVLCVVSRSISLSYCLFLKIDL